jgi:hypothetical protein
VRQANPQLQQADPKVVNPPASMDSVTVPNEAMMSGGSIVPGMAGMATGLVDDMGGPIDYSQASYDVFDPLNWMLDGLVDFPYNFNGVQGNELAGMDPMGSGM